MSDSIKIHRKHKGKLEVISKIQVNDKKDLSLIYTPGVAEVSGLIAKDNSLAYELTSKGNNVAIITDGSTVLGLGNIGPIAALPVMEGKAVLFKKFGGVNSFPICLDTNDVEEIIRTVKIISPSFGGINLEDISAPRCFEIEGRLREELDIPVFHDDQHGTAIVVLAGLINSLKVINRGYKDLKVVINGAGAAGIAISKILLDYGFKNLILVDSKGIVSKNREDINRYKLEIIERSDIYLEGTLSDALINSDIFIGVSKGGILTREMVELMNKDRIIFALSNPEPEISQEIASSMDISVFATGRSDLPNQINNALIFPSIFRAVFDCNVKYITTKMKIESAKAIANLVDTPTKNKIIPCLFNKKIPSAITNAIKSCIN